MTKKAIIILSIIVTLLVITNVCVLFSLGTLKKAAYFGESLGSFSALFSGLAFIGVLYTMFLQRDELKRQNKEFETNRVTNIVFKQLNYINDTIENISFTSYDEKNNMEYYFGKKGFIQLNISVKKLLREMNKDIYTAIDNSAHPYYKISKLMIENQIEVGMLLKSLETGSEIVALALNNSIIDTNEKKEIQQLYWDNFDSLIKDFVSVFKKEILIIESKLPIHLDRAKKSISNINEFIMQSNHYGSL